MLKHNAPRAAMVCIGDELLSGAVAEKNFNVLAKKLNKIGIKVCEMRIVADEMNSIVNTVNELRDHYDYVFTSGGIGPTHDDITFAALAAAFNVELEFHPAVEKIILDGHRKKTGNSVLKMAYLPRGCNLIYSKKGATPGIVMENVYVMAGVCTVFKEMLQEVAKELKTGEVVISQSLRFFVPESYIADELSDIQKMFSDVAIGSYPFVRSKASGTDIIINGIDKQYIADVVYEIERTIRPIENKYNSPSVV
jgi:molybdenum cofactor synthesis domain-containing protein